MHLLGVVGVQGLIASYTSNTDDPVVASITHHWVGGRRVMGKMSTACLARCLLGFGGVPQRSVAA
jgi:hypothetical protein